MRPSSKANKCFLHCRKCLLNRGRAKADEPKPFCVNLYTELDASLTAGMGDELGLSHKLVLRTERRVPKNSDVFEVI